MTTIKKKNSKKFVPIILCGGVGGRLWPVSRESRPKPFIELSDGESLLKKTLKRISKLNGIPRIDNKKVVIIVTNSIYYQLCQKELENTNLYGIFILEPFGKNTAPAILLSSLWIKHFFKDIDIFISFPADHMIENLTQFKNTINHTLNSITKKNALSLIGIKPSSPDSGFGYIKVQKKIDYGFTVKKFYEKPSKIKAKEYIASNNFLWNSGIMCADVNSFISEIKIISSNLFLQVNKVWNKVLKVNFLDPCKIVIDDNLFKNCPNVSIDKVFLEKTKNIIVILADFSWSDVGSWISFSKLIKSDKYGNKVIGDGVFYKSKDNIITSDKRFIATIGIEDLVIIDTSDALLVMKKSFSDHLKVLLSKFNKKQKNLLKDHITEFRPWGSFTVLYHDSLFKIKSIIVEPNKSLSLQTHKYRSEHWIVVSGIAEVTKNNLTFKVKTNESTFIPKNSKHRLKNPHKTKNLFIIEVQTGSYLGEDDIRRFKDDFGRSLSVF